MFNTINMYSEGLLTPEQAVRIINCMDYGEQIAIRTPKGIAALTFHDAKLLQGVEKKYYIEIQNINNKIASQRAEHLIKESQKAKRFSVTHH